MRIHIYTLLLILTPLLSHAALVTWTGGGAPGDWNDPLNWSTGALPTTADDVEINGSSFSVVLSTSTTVLSVEIRSGATFTVASTGILNLGNDTGATTNGSLDLSSSTGTIINDGVINIMNAAVDGIDSRGVFTNNGTITIDVFVEDGITASKTTSLFTNNGTITITNGADVGLIVREGALFTNSASGIITIDQVADEAIWIQETPNTIFNNSGAITISNVNSGSNHGIEVRSVFNNLTGGIIKITNVTGDGIRVEDHVPGLFTNAGTLIIDDENDAIENQGMFTSLSGSVFEIGCNSDIFEVDLEGPNPIDFSNTCINFDIASTSMHDQFEPGSDMVLTITGAAAKIDWGTFTPSMGDCFTIVDGHSTSSIVGTFASVTCSDPSIIFNVDYSDPTEIEICIVDCPALTAAAPMAVVSSESNCDTGTLMGGVVAAPATTCPPGATLMYSTDGTTFSTTVPIYDQINTLTVTTRCDCDGDMSPESTVTTVPGVCQTTCPDLSAPAPAVIVTAESNCDSGTPMGGVISAPTTDCPMGSALMYSTDQINFSTTLPTYMQTTAVTVSTRCDCSGMMSPVTTVITVPGTCIEPIICNGTGLEADASMNTYDLIASVLGPGGQPEEVPDCGHASFGDHITQAFDPDLLKDVFLFHLHVDEDDDRCINFDRQRNEIKTYSNSPANLLGVLGETVVYKWKFKLDVGFQPSSKFTHIHQLKSVGATNNEDSMPQITFTLRKGTPDQFELRYAEDFAQITWAQTDLTPFKGNWVEVTETVTYGDWGQGIYSVSINDFVSGANLLSYTNNATRMWKTNAAFIRPKWGIYRSLEDAEDLRDEIVRYSHFCIEETNLAPACGAAITFFEANEITSSSVDLVWGGVAGAVNYNWVVVPAGAGPNGTPVASGTSPSTTVTVTGLTDLTGYDVYITADCGATNADAFSFMTTEITTEVCTESIGMETSSSSSRGPIHQAGTGASTRYSRYLQIYTQAELAAVGLVPGSSITQLEWFITTNDVIEQGSSPLSIFLKNSTATMAVQDTWANLTAGSSLALNTVMDLSNNFPGSSGWMPFELDTPFVYTGGALEVAVEFNWDTAVFTNNGSVKWRWSNTVDDLMVRALGSSGYSTDLVYSSTSKNRANMQVCYEPPVVTCEAPSNLTATNITTSSADISWDAVGDADSYTWIIVPSGSGPDGAVIATGTSSTLSASISDLTCLTGYDLHVQADCGAGDISTFSVAYTFVTASAVPPNVLTLGMDINQSSTRGPLQQGGGTSTTRYSRFNMVYPQAELTAAGLTANQIISEIQWYIATTDVIVGAGDAPMKVWIKNSSATQATVISWTTAIAGSTQVIDRVFNTTNNFPGVEGWMPFTFNTPFVYTGGALEVQIEWDYGSVSIPAFSGSDASNPNGRAIQWQYSDFGTNVVVRRLGSGSHGTSNLSFASGSTLPSERANTQFLFSEADACDVPPPVISDIPTVGEWGLISLALCLTIVAVVRIKELEQSLA